MEKIINKETLIPISLAITLMVFTAYMERRLSQLENLYEIQSMRVEENTRKVNVIPGTEIIYRLNKIEEKLDRLDHRN